MKDDDSEWGNSRRRRTTQFQLFSLVPFSFFPWYIELVKTSSLHRPIALCEVQPPGWQTAATVLGVNPRCRRATVGWYYKIIPRVAFTCAMFLCPTQKFADQSIAPHQPITVPLPFPQHPKHRAEFISHPQPEAEKNPTPPISRQRLSSREPLTLGRERKKKLDCALYGYSNRMSR